VVLTRLPSTSTCEPSLMVVATYSASRGRNRRRPQKRAKFWDWQGHLSRLRQT